MLFSLLAAVTVSASHFHSSADHLCHKQISNDSKAAHAFGCELIDQFQKVSLHAANSPAWVSSIKVTEVVSEQLSVEQRFTSFFDSRGPPSLI